MRDARGIEAEQSVVGALYSRLDEIRDEAGARLADVRRAGPSGTPQNRSERDAFAQLYEDRVAQLDAVEDRLVFGRLDLADSTRLYVGRIGLSDAEHAPLLTDWRAPAAQAFYSATAASPSGVVLRRHLTTQARTVTAIEDDVLDVDAVEASGAAADLSGEGALLAALSRRRTGRMTDIVATIQAEQDAVIRAPLAGALVVQGGPGTGKTAVALHRAAYLLYHHRERLERSGVLLIGPSRSFLSYIDHVLPSLGETGAISTTLAGLVRDVDTSTREADDVAAVKGRAVMAKVVAAAVRERQRLPRGDQEVRVDGRTLAIRKSDVADAQARARRDGSPHNVARATFVKDMLGRLSAQLLAQLDATFTAEDRRDIEQDLRDHRDIRVALNLAWLPVTPEQLLRDLFSRPHLLEHAARGLSREERDLLARSAGAPFTDADVPLLDEAAELLGELPGLEAAEDGPSAEEIDYAKQVLSSFGGGGLVTAQGLARRAAGRGSRLSVAERAARDRTWTFGHVVVDEAQELSPMAWRMLVRRCPSRSFTIVGDVAQTAAAAGTRWWPETLDPIFGEHWAQRDLTISYRIPAAVAEAAQSYGRAAGIPVSELTAARDLEGAVGVTRADDPVATALALAADWATRLGDSGGGVVGVVVPEHAVGSARGQWEDLSADDVEVLVLGPREAKGLEFDVSIVADPTAIAQRPGDLYVALTRPTTRLELVTSGDLPAGLTG